MPSLICAPLLYFFDENQLKMKGFWKVRLYEPQNFFFLKLTYISITSILVFLQQISPENPFLKGWCFLLLM